MKKTYLKSTHVIFEEKIRKLHWLVKMRYIAPSFVWLVVVLSGFPGTLSEPLFLIYTPIAILFLIFNVGVDIYLRKSAKLPEEKRKKINLDHTILIQTLFDVILFTVIIYFDGSIESPVILMYLFDIIAVALLSKRIFGYISVSIISLLFSLIVFSEYFGILGHIFNRGEFSYYTKGDSVFSDLAYIVIMFFLIMYFLHYLTKESSDLGKELDKALVENEEIKEQYKDITDNALDLIQSIDKNGKFLYVNSMWREKLGYSKEEVKKKSVFDIVDEKDILKYKNILERLGVKDSQLFRTTLIQKDGGRIIVDGSISAKLDKDGHIISTSEVFRDVTKRVLTEGEMLEKTVELESLNKTMVGRELKMIELQEKIQELEGKGG